MNDAVSVAMYQTLLPFLDSTEFGAVEVLEALGLFIAKFVGSTAVGILLAMMVSYLLKILRLQQASLGLGLVVCTGYIAYTICEGAKLSGIMAVFFAGFAIKHYAYYNLPVEARTSLGDLLKASAFLAECSIYIFLGVAFFVEPAQQVWDVIFILISTFLCLLGRLLNVFPLTALANPFRTNKVSLKFQVWHVHGPPLPRPSAPPANPARLFTSALAYTRAFAFLSSPPPPRPRRPMPSAPKPSPQAFMWHSGLRGAIAFALVSTLPEQVSERSKYITTTLAIVVVSTLFIGVTATPLLHLLKIKTGDRVSPEDEERERQARLNAKPTSLSRRFHMFDKKYLLPLLTNKLEELSPERIEQYKRETVHTAAVSVERVVDTTPSPVNYDDDDEHGSSSESTALIRGGVN